jgi:hypothetical protein
MYWQHVQRMLQRDQNIKKKFVFRATLSQRRRYETAAQLVKDKTACLSSLAVHSWLRHLRRKYVSLGWPARVIVGPAHGGKLCFSFLDSQLESNINHFLLLIDLGRKIIWLLNHSFNSYELEVTFISLDHSTGIQAFYRHTSILQAYKHSTGIQAFYRHTDTQTYRHTGIFINHENRNQEDRTDQIDRLRHMNFIRQNTRIQIENLRLDQFESYKLISSSNRINEVEVWIINEFSSIESISVRFIQAANTDL